MKTFASTVRGRRPLSAHLVTITLDVDDHQMPGTGIPDEYLRVLIPPAGAELSLPMIDEKFTVTYPEGAVEPESRVYTISDLRIIDGCTQIDLDIALHEHGVGSNWARTCEPGDRVGLVEPHGLYAAPAGVRWQLLAADVTGLPALARILRGLDPGQHARAVVVLTDEADRIALPSPADVDVTWVQVEHDGLISEALSSAVIDADLPATDRYVWLAGEARASRAVRKHLRRTLGWPQSDFYTCGYWQLDAEKWNARFEQVAEQVMADALAAQEENADDEGAYLDALADIYDRAGL
ncbi:siderophore-interacting protein [Aeromicrobium sp. CF3.5]|uniref:siderophore-interacting protein n=1 Tax=Aeromicrobium sp. CF3.5 TaxID=3373078 RepID=UPI003EE4D933